MFHDPRFLQSVSNICIVPVPSITHWHCGYFENCQGAKNAWNLPRTNMKDGLQVSWLRTALAAEQHCRYCADGELNGLRNQCNPIDAHQLGCLSTKLYISLFFSFSTPDSIVLSRPQLEHMPEVGWLLQIIHWYMKEVGRGYPCVAYSIIEKTTFKYPQLKVAHISRASWIYAMAYDSE